MRASDSSARSTVVIADLDNLKAFNDYYGYPKADGVIRQTGDILREVVTAHGTADNVARDRPASESSHGALKT